MLFEHIHYWSLKAKNKKRKEQIDQERKRGECVEVISLARKESLRK